MKNDAPELQYKNLPVMGVKSLNEEEGIVEAFVAGIGNKDQVDDIIEPGSFSESLKARKPKGVWSHDWNRPVSKTLECYEVPAGDDRLPEKMKKAGIGGLYVKTQFNLETQDGRDALSWVKFYDDESEWSIGYGVEKQIYDKKVKAMRLKQINLYEYSPVIFGANPLTSTVGVKVLINNKDNSGVTEVKLQGLEDLDPEIAAKITEAVEGAVKNQVGDEIETELNDETKSLEASEDEEETVVEEETPEGLQEKQESEETDTKDAEIISVKADGNASPTFGKSEEVEDFKPAAIVTYLEKMMEDSVLSPRDVKYLDAVARSKVVATEGVYADGTKAVDGSYQDITSDICDALCSMYGGMDGYSSYAYPYSTFDDTVVYSVYNYMDEERTFYEASWSKGDDGEVVITDPKEVDVIEVVVAKAALIDALYKGHGLEIKKLLQPLVEISEGAEGDAEVKDILAKVGATVSQTNLKKLQTALENIESAAETIEGLLGLDDDTTADADDAKSLEDAAETKSGEDALAEDQASQETSEDEVITIPLEDLDFIKSLQIDLDD